VVAALFGELLCNNIDHFKLIIVPPSRRSTNHWVLTPSAMAYA
jgi:hypothetical protein